MPFLKSSPGRRPAFPPLGFKGPRLLLVLGLGAILILGWSPAPVLGAETGRRPAKLASPGLLDQLQTQDRIGVIVLLEGYESLSALGSPGDPALRLNVQSSVARLQDELVEKLGPTLVREVRRLENLPVLGLSVNRQGLEALAAMEEVALIQEDRRLALQTAQGVPLMQPGSFREGFGGAGVAVAVIDTGIDYTHPALGGGSAPPGGDQGDGGGIMTQTAAFPGPKVLGGFDFGENDPDPMDNEGHGTSAAGLAAGLNTGVGDFIGGVAPQAGLYALKVSGADGSIFESDFVAALDWCLSHQLDHPDQPLMIVSVSLGSPGLQANTFCDDISPAVSAVISSLAASGIAVFVSSGNDGFCAGISNPACLSQTIAVGSVFDAVLHSQYGPYLDTCVHLESCVAIPTIGCSSGAFCHDAASAPDQVPCYSNSGLILDILAPADCAYTPTAYGGYQTCFGGTSAACPMAAGAGAVVQSVAKATLGRFLSVEELRRVLKENGDPILDSKSGLTTPRVNIARAVAALEGLATDRPGDTGDDGETAAMPRKKKSS